MEVRPKLFGLCALLACFAINAQKGVGEGNGVSQDDFSVTLIELHGVVQNVVEEPCQYASGESEQGIHLIVCTDEKQELNVHIGPTRAVSIWTEGIMGHAVYLVVFSTENLPENHYIAKEIQWNGQLAQLRDGYMKPFWADRQDKEVW